MFTKISKSAGVDAPSLGLAAGLVVFCMVACGSGQDKGSTDSSTTGASSGQTTGQGDPKTRSANLDPGGAKAFDLAAVNKAAAEISSYSPGDKGFPYKGTAIDAKAFETWAAKHKGIVQKVLDQLDDGHILQVTGHTDNVGPREADAPTGRKGNIFYSTERAKAVHGALVKAGLPAPKMSFKGIADDEALKDVPADDQRQRRVTFKIAPATK